MKLETSLIPTRPRPDTTIPPAANAGSAETSNNLSTHPGSTQMFLRSHPVETGERGFLSKGSESKRILDHQKYRLGEPKARWIRRDL
jgi:hypothetical protein